MYAHYIHKKRELINQVYINKYGLLVFSFKMSFLQDYFASNKHINNTINLSHFLTWYSPNKRPGVENYLCEHLNIQTSIIDHF